MEPPNFKESNMPRIAGIDVPDNKPLRISMRYIYGIGFFQKGYLCGAGG